MTIHTSVKLQCLSELEMKVYSLIANYGPLAVSEIQDKTSLSRCNIKYALGELKRKNIIAFDTKLSDTRKTDYYIRSK